MRDDRPDPVPGDLLAEPGGGGLVEHRFPPLVGRLGEDLDRRGPDVGTALGGRGDATLGRNVSTKQVVVRLRALGHIPFSG